MNPMKIDIAGSVCSGLCLLHCLATPIILSTVSTGAVLSLPGNEWFHWLLILPVWLLAALSFPRGYQLHGSILPLFSAITGILIITLALFQEEETETLFTLIGAGILVFAHLKNRAYLAKLSSTFTFQ